MSIKKPKNPVIFYPAILLLFSLIITAITISLNQQVSSTIDEPLIKEIKIVPRGDTLGDWNVYTDGEIVTAIITEQGYNEYSKIHYDLIINEDINITETGIKFTKNIWSDIRYVWIYSSPTSIIFHGCLYDSFIVANLSFLSSTGGSITITKIRIMDQCIHGVVNETHTIQVELYSL